jgi:hypothetical protein
MGKMAWSTKNLGTPLEEAMSQLSPKDRLEFPGMNGERDALYKGQEGSKPENIDAGSGGWSTECRPVPSVTECEFKKRPWGQNMRQHYYEDGQGLAEP